MTCPRQCRACGEERSDVIETRETSLTIRRRRVCPRCQERWTTYEMHEADARWLRNNRHHEAEYWSG